MRNSTKKHSGLRETNVSAPKPDINLKRPSVKTFHNVKQEAMKKPGAAMNFKAVVKKEKVKRKKRKRIIVRNLSFKVDEEELKTVFSKFGTVLDVQIPLKSDGKKKGFGFVEFKETKSLIQAMKSMNYKEIHGRKVAIDFAVDKTSYQLKVQKLREDSQKVAAVKKEIKVEEDDDDIKSEGTDDSTDGGDKGEEVSDEEDEDEKRLNSFLENFYSGAETLTSSNTKSSVQSQSSDSSSDEPDESDSDAEDDEEVEDPVVPSSESKQRKNSNDVSEGKTVFIRNVSFVTDKESLRTAMEEYGECEYCLLCVDKDTDHPKGTAFVKFKEKSSADKLIEDSQAESGVLVDGRRLNCSCAVSREQITNLNDTPKHKTDKRNLYLLKAALIMADSKEAEGVSKSDMAKRNQLEIVKRQKLKNVNFFVSDKRLMIHNLPGNISDLKLRQMFKKAAGHGATVTEARVMKEFKKVDSSGNPLSKGFGFVCFSKHEDALKALNELNNNPKIFTPHKRPIVEFSVEDKMALLSREKRKERIQLRNKRRFEEKQERKLNQDAEPGTNESNPTKKGDKKKKRNKQNQGNKKNNEILPQGNGSKLSKREDKKSNNKNKGRFNRKNKDVVVQKETKNEKTKKEKNKKKKNRPSRDFNKESMTSLINVYKDKLKNKIS